MQITKLLTVNNKTCQTGSRKCAAGGIDIDQLHYLNAECPFWVLIYVSMIIAYITVNTYGHISHTIITVSKQKRTIKVPENDNCHCAATAKVAVKVTGMSA